MSRPEIYTYHGYLLPDVVSALQKAIRRGEEDNALYWAAEMDRSGYSEYCWKRLKVILSEDIGLAWPEGPAVFRGLYDNWQDLKKKKEGTTNLMIMHAVMLMARAKKSAAVVHACGHFYDAVDYEERREIPDEAYDRHTRRGRQMGRNWVHFNENGGRLNNVDETVDDPYADSWARLMRHFDKVEPYGEMKNPQRNGPPKQPALFNDADGPLARRAKLPRNLVPEGE